MDFNAISKCTFLISCASESSPIASIPASLQSAAISAPEQPSVYSSITISNSLPVKRARRRWRHQQLRSPKIEFERLPLEIPDQGVLRTWFDQCVPVVVGRNQWHQVYSLLLGSWHFSTLQVHPSQSTMPLESDHLRSHHCLLDLLSLHRIRQRKWYSDWPLSLFWKYLEQYAQIHRHIYWISQDLWQQRNLASFQLQELLQWESLNSQEGYIEESLSVEWFQVSCMNWDDWLATAQLREVFV